MPTPRRKVQTHSGETAVRIFAANERMNQLLLEQLDPAAWKSVAPGKVRTIAAVFTHMHNVRCKWLRLSAPHLKIPGQLNRSNSTPQQVSEGLAGSAAGIAQLLRDAFGDSAHRIEEFRRDGWAAPWPAGLEMLCYMVSHEAHHRGQVCMLAHQLGHPLKKAYELWNWEKLWRECGFREPLNRTGRAPFG